MVTKKELKEAIGKRVRLTYHLYGRFSSAVEGVLDDVNIGDNINLTDVKITRYYDGEAHIKEYPSLAGLVGRRKYDTFDVLTCLHCKHIRYARGHWGNDSCIHKPIEVQYVEVEACEDFDFDTDYDNFRNINIAMVRKEKYEQKENKTHKETEQDGEGEMVKRKPDFKIYGGVGVYSMWIDNNSISINFSKKTGDKWNVISKAVMYRRTGKGRKWLKVVKNKDSHSFESEDVT